MNRGILKSIGIIIGLIIVIISHGCKSAEQNQTITPTNTVEPAATPAQLDIPPEYIGSREIMLDKASIEQILEMTDGTKCVADVVEEFSFTNTNGTYRATLQGIEDTYYMMINTNGIDIIENLLYPQMHVEIISQNKGWTLNNPSSADIEQYIYNQYLAEDEARTTPIPIGEDDIYMLYYDVNRKETIIPVDIELQQSIIEAINNPVGSFIFDDLKDTDDYYFTTDIRVIVPQSDGDSLEYYVLINRAGEKALHCRKGYNAVIISEEIMEKVIRLACDYTNWFYVSLDEIQNVWMAQMWYNGDMIGEITDTGKLMELENMLYNARCIGYTPKTLTYGPYLNICTEVGQYQILMDWEDDLMMLGSSFHYDYGPGVTGTEPTDNYPKMLELFGLEKLDRDSYGDYDD